MGAIKPKQDKVSKGCYTTCCTLLGPCCKSMSRPLDNEHTGFQTLGVAQSVQIARKLASTHNRKLACPESQLSCSPKFKIKCAVK